MTTIDFETANSLEDIDRVAGELHALASVRRRAALASGEHANAHLDGVTMGFAEDLQFAVEAIRKRLGMEEDRVRAARDAIAARHGPTAPETLEAARKAAAQRLPSSAAVIEAAREAVAQQLDGRAAG